MIDISIIIVNYKSKTKLLNCLESIRFSDFHNLEYEIVVVDNNSGDDLSDISDIKLINSPVNLGMGGGNNLAVSYSKGEFILILNPDTYLSPQSIYLMWQYLKGHHEVGVLGPKLVNPDKSLQASCFHFPKWYIPILRRTFLGDYFSKKRDDFMMLSDNHNEIMEVDWLLGSCLFMRRIDFVIFDERYFMYFEDTDLCRQIKKTNKKIVYFPKTEIVHDHARQSAILSWYIAPFKDRLAREHIKSWFKYFIKWGL